MDRSEDIYRKLVDEGVTAIDEFIATRKSEELFLDFKRSSDNGSGSRLSQIDRNNLAKAISGFGNSEGGVIIWGVDCSIDHNGADVARFKVPIVNVTRFCSWIEGVISGCTVPPHNSVKNQTIIESNGNGYVITHIPKSNYAPHQMVGKLQYYIRAGSDFVPTPHQVLSGMFGRRPQPNVIINFLVNPLKIQGDTLIFQCGFLLRNKGPGIAKDPYLNCIILGFVSPNSQLSFDTPDLQTWTGTWSLGCHISMISKPEIRIPPDAHLQPTILNFVFSRPFNSDLKLEGTYGCSNSQSNKFIIQNSKENIEFLYNEIMQKNEESTLTQGDLRNYPSKILNIGEL